MDEQSALLLADPGEVLGVGAVEAADVVEVDPLVPGRMVHGCSV
ncbi:hypothetical protein [Streptomyces sp. NPDC002845]